MLEIGSQLLYIRILSHVYAICASGDLISDHLRHALYKFVARWGRDVSRGWGTEGWVIRHRNQRSRASDRPAWKPAHPACHGDGHSALSIRPRGLGRCTSLRRRLAEEMSEVGGRMGWRSWTSAIRSET